MTSHNIKHWNNITLESPNVDIKTDNLKLVNTPNNSQESTQLLRLNPGNNCVEICEVPQLSAPELQGFSVTTLNNINIGNSATVTLPGNSTFANSSWGFVSNVDLNIVSGAFSITDNQKPIRVKLELSFNYTDTSLLNAILSPTAGLFSIRLRNNTTNTIVTQSNYYASNGKVNSYNFNRTLSLVSGNQYSLQFVNQSTGGSQVIDANSTFNLSVIRI